MAGCRIVASRRPDDAALAGAAGAASLRAVTAVLLATDADWIFDEVEAALATRRHEPSAGSRRGRRAARAIDEVEPDLVILDLQIGNMGGMATCMAIRHEEGAGASRHGGADAARPGRRHVPGPPGRRRRLAHQAARRLPPAPGRDRLLDGDTLFEGVPESRPGRAGRL